MRALETEVSRLREAYTSEISDANVQLQQHKEVLHSVRTENDILKEILIAHGIHYEPELEQRRAERPPAPFQTSPIAASSTGSQSVGLANSISNQHTTPATSISPGLSPTAGSGSASGGLEHPDISPAMAFAPPQQVYHAGPSDSMGAMDRSACQAAPPVPAMGGVFETEPQLQIDFILTYATSFLPCPRAPRSVPVIPPPCRLPIYALLTHKQSGRPLP